MAAIRLQLNGQTRTVTAGPDLPLLWVLRNGLRLTGTKYGCGSGLCGACTVLLDGRPVRSCQLTLGAAAGASITTIEGLAREHARVQEAWFAEGAAPCKYCQPAMLLAAAALLREERRPSQAELDAAFAGMVCRCGSASGLQRAVRRAAAGGRT